MSQQQPPYAQPIAYHTPALGPRTPTSVTVLAVLGIVFGSLGALCSPFSLAPFLVGRYTPQGTSGNPAIDVIANDSLLMAWTVVSVLLGMLGAIWLLASSIGAIRLREWGRRGMIYYAWFALAMALVGIAVTATLLAPAQLRAASAAGAGAAGTPQAAQLYGGAIGSVVGGIFGSLFGCILPVCILIFLRKPHVIEAFATVRKDEFAQVA